MKCTIFEISKFFIRHNIYYGQPKVKCFRYILCGTCIEEFQPLKEKERDYTPI